jgi:hypothetical protein
MRARNDPLAEVVPHEGGVKFTMLCGKQADLTFSWFEWAALDKAVRAVRAGDVRVSVEREKS